MPNSPDSLPITRMLPGGHRIKRAKANRVFEYWYAWRGGPQILAPQASSAKSLAREVARKASAATAAYRLHLKSEKNVIQEDTLYLLITRYLDLMDKDKSLAPRTKDKARTWALADTIGGPDLVEAVREHTHTCYLGDRSHRHPWGWGCGACDACRLRADGWDRYHAAAG